MNGGNKVPTQVGGAQPQRQVLSSSRKNLAVWVVIIIVILAAVYCVYWFLQKPKVTVGNFQTPSAVNIPELPTGSSLEINPSNITPQVQSEIQNLSQEISNIDLTNLDSELSNIEQELMQ